MNSEAQQRRVLIVDDNVEAAELMQILLGLAGYDCRIAHNAELALAEVATYRPHAICSDILMPGMSGLQMAATLRQSDSCTETLLIAISGYSGDQAKANIFEAGFDAFFVKPVAYEDIYACLDAHFQRSDLPT